MDFKFSIGDTVTTQASLQEWELFIAENDKMTKAGTIGYGYGKVAIPVLLTVLERRLQECPGGRQVHYLCRYFGPQGYIEHLFNEIELVKHPKLPIKTEAKGE